jgi:hypothetical protein
MDGRQITGIKNRLRICLYVLIIIAGIPWPATANPKSEELKIKIADISLLRQQLADRSRQAEEIRRALSDQQAFFNNEIVDLCKNQKIKGLKQAQQIPRIRHDIELLRIIASYVDLLDQKIRFYGTGNDKLAYLQQSASDDLKMMATLNDLKIDALSTQISLVVNQYLPEAHIIQIHPQHVEPVPAETVWKQIVQLDN